MEGKVIYPELSYKIVGVLYKIHRELGSRYQEKYYQRAAAIAFDQEGLKYQREIKVDLKFDDKIIGKYILDFLVEEKVVVEFKTVGRLSKEDIRQVLAYLKAKNLKLGILVNFRSTSLEYIRILNSDI